MSSAGPAPESDEESRRENSDAPDPRHTTAEEFAEVDVRRCQADNRNGRQCGRDSIPGTFYCPFHLPDHVDETDRCEGGVTA
ncbi:hypothetical protein [Haloarchaeobius sp. HRN-SO-5]|uniref:hypothetical protein n=1 Tax=Haloarchaeobius sp. HRN-SO-5 TaxID=3446118 RepID=UPI003EB85BEC